MLLHRRKSAYTPNALRPKWTKGIADDALAYIYYLLCLCIAIYCPSYITYTKSMFVCFVYCNCRYSTTKYTNTYIVIYIYILIHYIHIYELHVYGGWWYGAFGGCRFFCSFVTCSFITDEHITDSTILFVNNCIDYTNYTYHNNNSNTYSICKCIQPQQAHIWCMYMYIHCTNCVRTHHHQRH